MEYYLAIKKNEIFPSATTWMDLEGIMLSEVRQRRINTVWSLLYSESKNKNQPTQKANKTKLIDSEHRLVFTRESRWGIGEMRFIFVFYFWRVRSKWAEYNSSRFSVVSCCNHIHFKKHSTDDHIYNVYVCLLVDLTDWWKLCTEVISWLLTSNTNLQSLRKVWVHLKNKVSSSPPLFTV